MSHPKDALPHFSIRQYLEVDTSPPPLPSTLPLPPNPPQSTNKYTVSTHVIPSSFTRHTPLVTPPPLPSGETKADRINSAKRTMDELQKNRIEAWNGAYGFSRQALLWNCVNRYVPRQDRPRGRGITLFVAHANGFPKEIWETSLTHLFSLESAVIEEVWVWESVQHGDSALLNREQESAVFDWPDNSNDILSFLLHYLPSKSGGELPTHLPRLVESDSVGRSKLGFAHRKLVAIGHSYGGCTSTLSALRYPELFDALILVDPVISKRDPSLELFETISKAQLVLSAVQRRSEWGSRAEALKSFSLNPFFSVWDPLVLQTYVDRGLYETPRGTASLKMTGIQEAACFLDTLTAKEVYQLVEALDTKIELFWIMPGKKEEYPIGGPGGADILVQRRPENSSSIRVPNAGHLIPMEAPLAFAQAVATFLLKKYGAAQTKL